jgi:hypothetical protein
VNPLKEWRVTNMEPTTGESDGRSDPTRRRRRRLCSRGGIILLLALALFSHLIGRHVVRVALQAFYTPPALTREMVSTYTKFIELAEAHPEFETIFLNNRGVFDCKRAEPAESAQVRNFSAGEVHRLVHLPRDLQWAGCVYAEKRNSYIVFIPDTTYILPRRAGVLYSSDGQNPNRLRDEFVEKRKPFMLIKDRWYASKRLIVSRTRNPVCLVPIASLIDRSAQDPGILEAH